MLAYDASYNLQSHIVNEYSMVHGQVTELQTSCLEETIKVTIYWKTMHSNMHNHEGFVIASMEISGEMSIQNFQPNKLHEPLGNAYV